MEGEVPGGEAQGNQSVSGFKKRERERERERCNIRARLNGFSIR
jgi:hypothetical protein